MQANLIIFHPYDKGHWVLTAWKRKNDLFYIKYLDRKAFIFQECLVVNGQWPMTLIMMECVIRAI